MKFLSQIDFFLFIYYPNQFLFIILSQSISERITKAWQKNLFKKWSQKNSYREENRLKYWGRLDQRNRPVVLVELVFHQLKRPWAQG